MRFIYLIRPSVISLVALVSHVYHPVHGNYAIPGVRGQGRDGPSPWVRHDLLEILRLQGYGGAAAILSSATQ